MKTASGEGLLQADKIGLGVQYCVYGYGADRVLKVPNSPAHTMQIIRDWKTGPKSSRELEAYIKLLAKDRRSSVKFVESRSELMNMMGNPIFEGESYTQDRAVTLQEWFVIADEYEARKTIDDYFSLTYLQWRHGFADKAYNFASGYGTNKKGELIMLDFGEITTDLKAAKGDVEAKVWLNRRSYLELLPDSYKPYFKQRSEELLTVDRLADQWGELSGGYLGMAS